MAPQPKKMPGGDSDEVVSVLVTREDEKRIEDSTRRENKDPGAHISDPLEGAHLSSDRAERGRRSYGLSKLASELARADIRHARFDDGNMIGDGDTVTAYWLSGRGGRKVALRINLAGDVKVAVADGVKMNAHLAETLQDVTARARRLAQETGRSLDEARS